MDETTENQGEKKPENLEKTDPQRLKTSMLINGIIMRIAKNIGSMLEPGETYIWNGVLFHRIDEKELVVKIISMGMLLRYLVVDPSNYWNPRGSYKIPDEMIIPEEMFV